jgi:hypothetical protein
MLSGISQPLESLVVDVVKPAKRFPDNVRPKLTFSKGLSTATQLVLPETSFPNESQLPCGTKSIDLSQQHVQKSATTPARTCDEKNFASKFLRHIHHYTCTTRLDRTLRKSGFFITRIVLSPRCSRFVTSCSMSNIFRVSEAKIRCRENVLHPPTNRRSMIRTIV